MTLQAVKFQFKDWATRMINAFMRFCLRYTYSIPLVMGLLILLVAGYLFYSTIDAVGEMNRTIHTIPIVVQTEMQKTREVFRKEADANREIMMGEHQMTREEILDRITASDEQRKRLKLQLDQIEKQLNRKPEPPKRQKVLGVF